MNAEQGSQNRDDKPWPQDPQEQDEEFRAVVRECEKAWRAPGGLLEQLAEEHGPQKAEEILRDRIERGGQPKHSS